MASVSISQWTRAGGLTASLRGALCVAILVCLELCAAEPAGISLPAAQTAGGKPLMEALRERKTTRELTAEPLPTQLLSDLLWAAFGVNRPETAQRTAPSAMNAQEIDLFVASPEALYLFDAAKTLLQPIQDGDIRPATGGQDFAKRAPISIILVANYARMTKAKPEQKELYAAFDAGCISQNLYLFCASAGLGTVVHDLDRPALAAAMHLRPEQKIVFVQAVGFPVSPSAARAALLSPTTVRSISTPYRYPILPGTEEWKAKKMDPWSACQIPSELLTNLTDQALVATVLHYPMRGDLNAFNTVEQGLAVMRDRFDALPEMFSRPGSAAWLIERFRSFTIEQLAVKEVSNENLGFLDLNFVSALLCYPEVFAKLTQGERAQLLSAAVALQEKIHHQWGPSASEEPIARLAARLRLSGVGP